MTTRHLILFLRQPRSHNVMHSLTERLGKSGWKVNWPDYRGGVYSVSARKGELCLSWASYTQGGMEFSLTARSAPYRKPNEFSDSYDYRKLVKYSSFNK